MKTKDLFGPLFYVGLLLLFCGNSYAENIDPYNDDSQYAWGENIGWLNFEPSSTDGVHVESDALTGWIWAENTGWVSLSCDNTSSCSTVDYGITNDGEGRLSGFAWGENVGWINFNPSVPGDSNIYGVTIDYEGNFSGWAWAENLGWIRMRSIAPVAYKVQTSWQGIVGTCWDIGTCAGQTSGDATCDGNVNLGDLIALKASFGTCAPWIGNQCCADFNQDGCVNLGDLIGLKAGFGGIGYSPSTGNQSCPP